MIRLVRCPKCREVLLESPEVPRYDCGGCGARLRAKKRNNNAHALLKDRRTGQNGSAMSSEPTAKYRVVRCPECRQVLLESPDVPVYECGGCGVRLQGKNRNNNAHGGTAPGLPENATAQTSNSDPSPAGMDRSNKTVQRVAGDSNSKQLEDDENRRVPHTDTDEGENGAQDQSSSVACSCLF